MSNTDGEFNELATLDSAEKIMSPEKDYVEQSNLDWRQSKVVSSDIVN